MDRSSCYEWDLVVKCGKSACSCATAFKSQVIVAGIRVLAGERVRRGTVAAPAEIAWMPGENLIAASAEIVPPPVFNVPFRSDLGQWSAPAQESHARLA